MREISGLGSACHLGCDRESNAVAKARIEGVGDEGSHALGVQRSQSVALGCGEFDWPCALPRQRVEIHRHDNSAHMWGQPERNEMERNLVDLQGVACLLLHIDAPRVLRLDQGYSTRRPAGKVLKFQRLHEC